MVGGGTAARRGKGRVSDTNVMAVTQQQQLSANAAVMHFMRGACAGLCCPRDPMSACGTETAAYCIHLDASTSVTACMHTSVRLTRGSLEHQLVMVCTVRQQQVHQRVDSQAGSVGCSAPPCRPAMQPSLHLLLWLHYFH